MNNDSHLIWESYLNEDVNMAPLKLGSSEPADPRYVSAIIQGLVKGDQEIIGNTIADIMRRGNWNTDNTTSLINMPEYKSGMVNKYEKWQAELNTQLSPDILSFNNDWFQLRFKRGSKHMEDETGRTHLNMYWTLKTDTSSIEDISQTIENVKRLVWSVAKKLEDISKNNNTYIAFKLPRSLTALLLASDNLKVYYNDPQLKDNIYSEITSIIDQITGHVERGEDRTHGFDKPSGQGGSYSQLVGTNTAFNLIRYFQDVKSKRPREEDPQALATRVVAEILPGIYKNTVNAMQQQQGFPRSQNK